MSKRGGYVHMTKEYVVQIFALSKNIVLCRTDGTPYIYTCRCDKKQEFVQTIQIRIVCILVESTVQRLIARINISYHEQMIVKVHTNTE